MNTTKILAQLSQKNYKITAPRKNIARALQKIKGLFCVEDILKKYPELDKVSVYRTLELFAELDIIRPAIVLDHHQYYEKHDDESHHHHIVCTECKKTKCVPCSFDTKTIPGFKKIIHTTVLTGICNTCNS